MHMYILVNFSYTYKKIIYTNTVGYVNPSLVIGNIMIVYIMALETKGPMLNILEIVKNLKLH